MNQGYALAVLEFQDALMFDPNISTIHLSMADAYRRLEKFVRSEEHLRISMELDPEDIETLEMLGQLLISKKDYRGAQDILKLKKIDPENINYIFALADLYQIDKEWDLAIDYYIKGYLIDNSAANGLEQALQIALTTSRFKRAQEICELLIVEDQTNIKLLETMKDLSIYNEDYNSALDILDMLEEIQGYTPGVVIQKSAILEEIDQPDLALGMMLEAVKKR